MNIGDSFVNRAAPKLPSHFWVVISDPHLDEQDILLVNLTDAENHEDHSCVLEPGDHPWITKRSVVAYQFAKLTTLDRLNEALSSDLIDLKEPVSDDALDAILDGAYDSDELSGRHRVLLRTQKLID